MCLCCQSHSFKSAGMEIGGSLTCLLPCDIIGTSLQRLNDGLVRFSPCAPSSYSLLLLARSCWRLKCGGYTVEEGFVKNMVE